MDGLKARVARFSADEDLSSGFLRLQPLMFLTSERGRKRYSFTVNWKARVCFAQIFKVLT